MITEIKNKTIIDYNQGIDYNTIGDLLTLYNKEIDSCGIKSNLKKRIYSIIVEGLENVLKHGIPNIGSSLINVIFKLSLKDTLFTISIDNKIENSKIENLTKKLSYVNELDVEEIKELYKSLIRKNRISEQGGAGIGIVEIAKISKRKINYSFANIDDKYSTFHLKAEINIK